MEQFRKMGRPARVSKEEAVRVIEKYIEHFQTNEMPPSGSSVWRAMSKDLDKKWLPHSVYTAVRENKKDILSTARLNKGIIVPEVVKPGKTSPVSTYSSEPEMQDNSCIENQVIAPSKSLMSWYFLTVDGEVWDRVRPKNSFELGQKWEKYKITTPTEWTDAIFAAFSETFHFPCSYLLKRAKVYNSRDSLHYIEIYGECRSQKCSNRFMGYVEDEPWAGDALEIHVKTWDTSLDDHENVRRPVRNVKRRVFNEDDALEETNNRKKKAGNKSDYGESEEMRIINRLMEMYRQDESIRGIGLIPSHYTMYTPPRQIQAYNEYCHQEWSSVKIDMRKGFVRKINRANNLKSEDIFLISLVINYKEKIFLAYQMISETTDYLSIHRWLESWIAKGASRPKEAVSNYCRVFLAAMCQAFNGFSLEHYISGQFASVSGSEPPDYEWQITAPKTYIRVDINNLLQVVSQWRCFENVYHPCVREFYVQCVDLLIHAKTFDEFTEVLFFTVVMAVSLFEDDLLEVKKLTPKMIRKKLEVLIATNKNVIQIPDYNRENCPEQEQPVLEDFLIHKNELTAVTLWSDKIVKEAKLLKKRGSEVNAFYAPQFADQLVALALDFPLWTTITVPNEQTSPWPIEEYFKDWEPRFLTEISPIKQFPIRADHFVKAHLQEINKSVATLKSLLKNYKTERVSTDGTLKLKYSGNKAEVSLLHEKDDTSSLTEYLDFEKNDTSTPGNDAAANALELNTIELISSENSPTKAPVVNNIISAYVMETDELGVHRRRNISLNFSEI